MAENVKNYFAYNVNRRSGSKSRVEQIELELCYSDALSSGKESA